MHFEVKRTIRKPPSLVWRILTDKNRLLTEPFGITKLEGEIAPQSQIKLWSEVSPNRAFALKVTQFESPGRMVWSGGMPFGLFKGIRTFTLEPSGDTTEFCMREDYVGLFAPMIFKSIPDLTPSFEKFGDTLKRVSEGK